MRPHLLLRFDAPLVSFGATVVDNYGVVQAFPGLSMLTGLLANALGYDHRQANELDRLQARIRYAARCDVDGAPLRDYQTVDLGQPHLDAKTVAWTTLGRVETRGGASGAATHIRYRDYRADSVHTVALCLDPADEPPLLDELAHAIRRPERPLFIGRKCCLPACPMFMGIVEATSPLAALASSSAVKRHGATERELYPVWWEDGDAAEEEVTRGASRTIAVTDERDWFNQIHGGQRIVREGRMAIAISEVRDG
jgi:CRISPR system Cascade subunit CasD